MSKPRRCPLCGSHNVDYSRPTFSDEQNTGIVVKGYCYLCRTHFMEHYDTVFKGSHPYTVKQREESAGVPVSCTEEQ